MSESNGHCPDPVFIEDGYTVEGYVDGVKGIHGPLAFMFRPVLSPESHKIWNKWNYRGKDSERLKPSEDEANYELQVKTLVGQLASWEIRNSAGDAVAITSDTVKRLHPVLLDKVFNRILALDPRDDRQAADAKN